MIDLLAGADAATTQVIRRKSTLPASANPGKPGSDELDASAITSGNHAITYMKTTRRLFLSQVAAGSIALSAAAQDKAPQIIPFAFSL